MDLSSHFASTDDAVRPYPSVWLATGHNANDSHDAPTLAVGEILPLAPPRCRDPLEHLPHMAGLAERLILAFPPLIVRGTSRSPATLAGFPELTAGILRRLAPAQRVHVHWLPPDSTPFTLPLDAIMTRLSSAERLTLSLPHQELLLGTANPTQAQIARLLCLSAAVVCRHLSKIDSSIDAANDAEEACAE